MATLLVVGAALALTAPSARAQPPAPGTPSAIDGPSAAIPDAAGLDMSIARDGTGGLVYLKDVNGTAHVFVSRLVGGAFQSPAQVDSGLAGASRQPVIAAGNGGLLLVAFINAGQLYVVDGPAGAFGPPMQLASAAQNPAISITNFGKAYLAFAVADRGGHDVRAAYYNNGSWALEAPPLNAVNSADDAGSGTGRGPAVAAAGDGIAIVAWGERGRIYSRRVWGTGPSVVDEQADAPLAGCTESSADEPTVGAGGDSSYAPVAFREALICGGQPQSRVLMNRLHGSLYDGVTEADGLSAASTDSAANPQIAVGEYGSGWITSELTSSDDVVAASLASHGVFAGAVTQVNSTPGSQQPYAVPATAGLRANLIAWQEEPGSTPGGQIGVRFAGDGSTLGPETVLSSPLQGPTDASDASGGLAAAGDTSGDVAVAWLQGSAGQLQVMVNQLYQPPGGFSPVKASAYTNTPQPVLAWTRPHGWGPFKYSVSVDGNQLAQTYSTSAQVPAPLANGPHSWQVIASNPAGQQSETRLAAVFVDTVAPTAAIRLARRARLGHKVRAVLRYFDRPPAGEPRFDASGARAVTVRWGDGTVVHLKPGQRVLTHLYRRPGRYRVTLRVIDRAGNSTTAIKFVRVVKR